MYEPDRLRPTEATATKIHHLASKGRAVAAEREVSVIVEGVDVARRGWLRVILTSGVLVLVWGGLTGWDPLSWVFGVPVVIAAAALAFRFKPAPKWSLSVFGALRFVVWFAVASARGSFDVARRALSWNVAVNPGFRSYRMSLPPGPARIVFANAITLLPGTLTAELSGEQLEVHMLDTNVDLETELGDLEARVRALFALPDVAPAPQTRKSGGIAPVKIEETA